MLNWVKYEDEELYYNKKISAYLRIKNHRISLTTFASALLAEDATLCSKVGWYDFPQFCNILLPTFIIHIERTSSIFKRNACYTLAIYIYSCIKQNKIYEAYFCNFGEKLSRLIQRTKNEFECSLVFILHWHLLLYFIMVLTCLILIYCNSIYFQRKWHTKK